MKNPSNKDKMLAYVKSHAGSTRDQIGKALKLAPIVISKMGNSFVQAGVMEYTNKVYSLVGDKVTETTSKTKRPLKAKTEVKAEVKAEKKPEIKKADKIDKAAKVEVTTDENKEGKNFGRDFGKYSFQGELLRKGALVLAVIHAIVKKNPAITYKELQKHFPQSMVRTFGVIVPLTEAKKANAKGRVRYFTKHNQILQLKEGSFAVTNQISSQNFDPIIDAAKAAGIKIE